jgi:perosamine synthetase
MSCKISEIKKIAEQNNFKVIEDAAESLGSSVGNKKVGSLSDIAIFSFCGNKVLTTGEGGAVVTNSRQLYEKIKLIRSHGRIDNQNYFNDPNNQAYVGIGYNWRMSSITASLGISQMAKLDKLIKMRQENARFLSSKLTKIPDIKIPKPPEGYEHIYQMYCILLRDQNIRDKLHDYLTKKKIFSKVYFPPIHNMDFYRKKYKYDGLPTTEKISNTILTLPLYPNMTDEEKNYLVESIFEFFESRSIV